MFIPAAQPLQQLAAATRYLLVEVDLHKLPEATAVVVANSFGVPKSFQQRVGCRVGQGTKRPVTKTHFQLWWI